MDESRDGQHLSHIVPLLPPTSSFLKITSVQLMRKDVKARLGFLSFFCNFLFKCLKLLLLISYKLFYLLVTDLIQ